MTKLLYLLIKPRLAEQLRSMLMSVAASPAPAIVLREQNDDQTIVGVLVTPDEYELLIATYKLVKSPDGPSKIAGTYPYKEMLPEAMYLKDAVSSYQ